MPANYTITTRTTGETVTAAKYNADHQNHIDHMTPTYIDDYSTNLTQYQATTNPGDVGSESLPTTLAGEIERLRYTVAQIKTVVAGSAKVWNATLSATNLFRVQNIKAFGGVGDGVTDDSTAFQNTITAAQGSGGMVYIPKGRFYVPTAATVTSGSITIIGDDPETSVLLAKAATTPESGADLVSWTILSITGATGVYLRNLRFDGGITSITHCPQTQTTQTYIKALLDIRSSTRILLDNVTTINSSHSQAVNSGTGLFLSPVETALNSGPVFIYNSSQIYIKNCRLLTPSFLEGWTMVNVQKVVIDQFYSNAGYDSHATYGTSSPIRILGPLTEQITIRNSYFYNPNGLCLNVGGTNDFLVEGCQFLGATAAIDLPARAGRAGGINMNKVITKDLAWAVAHPNMKNCFILNNVFRNNSGSLITIGGSATAYADGDPAAFEQFVIMGNDIYDSWYGVQARLTYGLTIANNKFRKVLAYQVGYGYAIDIGFSTDVLIQGNTVDGTETVSYDSATRKHEYSIYANRSQRVTIKSNKLLDANSGNIVFACAVAADNTYSNLVVTDNNILNVTVVPSTPVLLGTDATHRVSVATVLNNTVNGGPFSGANFTQFITTMWDGECAFGATRGTDVALATGATASTIVFNSSQYNANGHYNTATGEYTAPWRGVYEFRFNGYVDTLDAGKRIEGFIFVNGSSISPVLCWHQNYSAGSGFTIGFNGCLMAPLLAGDVVTCRLRQNSAGSINVVAGSAFSGNLIGRR